MVIFRQLNYIRNMEMGYDREQIIHMNMVGDSNEKYETLKQEFGKGRLKIIFGKEFAEASNRAIDTD